ncbi:hypothetical protein [Luteococcus sp.]|uniref:hypothetical protein n=1 Tax=Luteococcus sp. TaxID=1969402 RepID=UPI003735A771
MDAIAVTDDAVHIGGNFNLVNGTTRRGSAALSATDGNVQRWDFNQVVHNSGINAGIYSLGTDGRNIIATGYSYLSGQFEGAALIEPGTGALAWMADCHGDSYSAAAGHGLVYVASHHHHCDNINSFPQVNSTTFKYAQAFTYQATGTAQQGLARFARPASPLASRARSRAVPN